MCTLNNLVLPVGHQSLASTAKSLGGRGGGREEGSHVLRLRNDGIVTSDVGCGRLERARREEARELRFRVAVFVNGSKVVKCSQRFESTVVEDVGMQTPAHVH